MSKRIISNAVCFFCLSLLFSCENNKSKVTLTVADKRKIRVCTEIPPKPIHNGNQLTRNAFGNFYLFWPDTTTVLNVEFLDGDLAIEQKVIASAKKWEPYTGIVFNFGHFAKADITISFKDVGSWSYIGSDSRNHVPSMNFGWFDAYTADSEYDRTVLHEFGHALGLYHEHQTSNGNPIHWNKALVYAYYEGPPNNWKQADIDENIFKRYSGTIYNGSKFDKLSIMLYETPAQFTTDGYHTEENDELSPTDIQFIESKYPNH